MIFAAFNFGLRNILLSFIHFFSRFLTEDILIKIIMTFQLVVLFHMHLLFCKKVYKNKLMMWLIIFLSMVRLTLMFTLFIDFEGNSSTIQTAQLVLIMLMIAIFSLGIIIALSSMIKFYLFFFMKNLFHKFRTEKRLKIISQMKPQ